MSIELTLDENAWLPPAPSKDKKGVSCTGGVVLTARNNTIICRNTLDSRLDLCFERLIPTIRGLLFGLRPVIERAPVSSGHH
jgi:V-type H+-transporting ATPase subunit E